MILFLRQLNIGKRNAKNYIESKASANIPGVKIWGKMIGS
tara:strand:- start:1 stop:120 length:120 start_codon:yes stop_codon:yes gene_type:complete